MQSSLIETILFSFVPKFSDEIKKSASNIELIKNASLSFMRDLAHLVFEGQKIILNS